MEVIDRDDLAIAALHTARIAKIASAAIATDSDLAPLGASAVGAQPGTCPIGGRPSCRHVRRHFFELRIRRTSPGWCNFKFSVFFGWHV